jgi:hypothetical protein
MRARSGVESVPRCQVTMITRARGEPAMSGRDSLGYGDGGGGASEVCRGCWGVCRRSAAATVSLHGQTDGAK